MASFTIKAENPKRELLRKNIQIRGCRKSSLFSIAIREGEKINNPAATWKDTMNRLQDCKTDTVLQVSVYSHTPASQSNKGGETKSSTEFLGYLNRDELQECLLIGKEPEELPTALLLRVADPNHYTPEALPQDEVRNLTLDPKNPPKLTSPEMRKYLLEEFGPSKEQINQRLLDRAARPPPTEDEIRTKMKALPEPILRKIAKKHDKSNTMNPNSTIDETVEFVVQKIMERRAVKKQQADDRIAKLGGNISELNVSKIEVAEDEESILLVAENETFPTNATDAENLRKKYIIKMAEKFGVDESQIDVTQFQSGSVRFAFRIIASTTQGGAPLTSTFDCMMCKVFGITQSSSGWTNDHGAVGHICPGVDRHSICKYHLPQVDAQTQGKLSQHKASCWLSNCAGDYKCLTCEVLTGQSPTFHAVDGFVCSGPEQHFVCASHFDQVDAVTNNKLSSGDCACWRPNCIGNHNAAGALEIKCDICSFDVPLNAGFWCSGNTMHFACFECYSMAYKMHWEEDIKGETELTKWLRLPCIFCAIPAPNHPDNCDHFFDPAYFFGVYQQLDDSLSQEKLLILHGTTQYHHARALLNIDVQCPNCDYFEDTDGIPRLEIDTGMEGLWECKLCEQVWCLRCYESGGGLRKIANSMAEYNQQCIDGTINSHVDEGHKLAPHAEVVYGVVDSLLFQVDHPLCPRVALGECTAQFGGDTDACNTTKCLTCGWYFCGCCGETPLPSSGAHHAIYNPKHQPHNCPLFPDSTQIGIRKALKLQQIQAIMNDIQLWNNIAPLSQGTKDLLKQRLNACTTANGLPNQAWAL
jgi:hypothetical protein